MEENKISAESKLPHFFKKENYKKSPKSFLIATPYITLQISIKNLELFDFKSLIKRKNSRRNSLKNLLKTENLTKEAYNIHFNTPGFFYEICVISESVLKTNELDLESEIKSKLVAKSSTIYSFSPIWQSELTIDVKCDDIIFVILNSIQNNYKNDIIGFQMINLAKLEKGRNLSGNLTMEIIDKNINEYSFVNHKYNTLTGIERFNTNQQSQQLPLISIDFDYTTFLKLWKMSVIVHSIIERHKELKDTFSDKYYYRLYCRRGDGLNWFKEVSLSDINNFRKKLISDVNSIKNIPFPSKSILEYVPFISKYYSDENDDNLITKKFTLDNFFDNIMEINEIYKFDYFNEFFSSE